MLCIGYECGIILFPLILMSNGWTVERKPFPIEPPNLGTYPTAYSLTIIVTMDKDGVLKVACCSHCGNLNSSEELFDD